MDILHKNIIFSVEPEVSSLEGIKPSQDTAENCLTDSQPMVSLVLNEMPNTNSVMFFSLL